MQLSTLGPQLAARLCGRIAGTLVSNQFPAIERMELFLTERCTLRCDYCFVANKRASRRMSWEVGRAAVDYLMRESRDRDHLEITFIGGEPLLEFGLIQRVVEYADEQGDRAAKRVGYSVTTNGTVMTEEIARFAQAHGFNYLLSVDGDRTAHDRHRKTANGAGSWDVAMGANFELLRSVQPWIGARVTVSPDTVDRLSSGVRELHQRGVNQFIVAPNQDDHWGPEHLASWEAQTWELVQFSASERATGSPIRISLVDSPSEDGRDKYVGLWGCWAGRSTVAVSCSGDLYPCSRFVSPFPNMGDRFRLGNVYEGITNHAARVDLTDPAPERRAKCFSCDLRDACCGPCPAIALHMSGDIYTPSPLDCVMARLRRELADATAEQASCDACQERAGGEGSGRTQPRPGSDSGTGGPR